MQTSLTIWKIKKYIYKNMATFNSHIDIYTGRFIEFFFFIDPKPGTHGHLQLFLGGTVGLVNVLYAWCICTLYICVAWILLLRIPSGHPSRSQQRLRLRALRARTQLSVGTRSHHAEFFFGVNYVIFYFLNIIYVSTFDTFIKGNELLV